MGKALSKECKIKGKNLFHPVRLALTGEMSGQDVTKQLSLLSMACQPDSVICREKVGVVSFDDRISRLKSFLDTIPEEYRAARTKEEKKKEEKVKENTTDAVENQVQSISTSVADPKDTYEGPPITALDIRVGRIAKVWEHEEADKLFCEEIDVGEDEPRQIASGLKPYLKQEDLEDR